MDPLVWSILLITVGLICLTAELFVPSGGILGTLTFAALTAGVIVAFYKGLTYGTAMLLFVSISLPIFFAAAAKIWPETPMGKWIMLRRPESPEEVLPEQDRGGGLRTLVGSSGVSKSKMLPGGVVSIGGRSYEAVSDGDAIENDQPIVVIGVHLRRLIVRRDDHPRTAPEVLIVAPNVTERPTPAKPSGTPSTSEPTDDQTLDHPPIEGMGGIEDPFR
jgi:membrane-bound ClpP family serine protease